MANAGGALEECAEFTRGGGAPTPDHDAAIAARKARVKAEQQRLVQWAEANGKLGANPRLPPEYTRGGEHQVYFERRTQRYFKATLPHKHLGYGIALGSIIHGATPAEYLDRLSLQNKLFDDDILLERIVVTADKPIVVTSQPSIKGVAAPQEDLDGLMKRKGFEVFAEGAFYDGKTGLLIFDLFPRNAIQVESGEIFPIDPVIQRVTEEFADFLREHPNTINLR